MRLKGFEYKKCFYCQSKNVQKYGKVKGEQRYKCNHCSKQFMGGIRIDNDLLWYEYVYRKQTLIQLAKTYKCSSKTIQRRIKKHQKTRQDQSAKSIILLLDTTYWKRSFGVMLFKDAITGNNLLKYYVRNETTALYLNGINELEQKGYRILAVVCDGRRGLLQKITKYPVQLCQYHQQQIIRRYLPNRSKHPSTKHLRLISNMLTDITEEQCRDFLEQWLDTWKDYYEERSINPETGRSHYTHKRLRSAFRSLYNNLCYLFTYQRYPELPLPNTSNMIEGCFGNLKQLLGNHRGMRLETKKAMIDEILGV